ncbi:hypothetical protein Hanom_Chr17g01562301 [Helianthus anomalus]
MDIREEVMDDDEIEDEEVVDFRCGGCRRRRCLTTAKVCTGRRDVTKQLWKVAEEVRLRVPTKVQVGFAGSVFRRRFSFGRLQKGLG